MSNLELEKLELIEQFKDEKYQYSQSVDGNFNCLESGEFSLWKYKYYVKQIEDA